MDSKNMDYEPGCEPAVFRLELSSYESMNTELAWRFQDVMQQIRSIQTDLKGLRRALKNGKEQETTEFDPLRTIGKY
jgi:hypothetical protein